jgi:MoxR-like ATPase
MPKSTRAAVNQSNGNCTAECVPPRLEIVELKWHSPVRLLLDIGKPPLILLAGEPGTGKTTFVRQVAAEATGQPPVVLSGSPEIEQGHLWGRWTLAGDQTRFVDGPLPLALKADRWLLIEEFSQIPLECRSALMPLRDQAEITNPMTGEVLPITEQFRLVATSNSETLTCRKNSGIAKVLYDGFQIYDVPELGDQQVQSFLRHNFPHAEAARVQRVLVLWNEWRDFSNKGSSGRSHLSYRAADHLMRLLEAGMQEAQAIQVALVNKFLPSDPDLYSAAKLRNTLAENTESPATNGDTF